MVLGKFITEDTKVAILVENRLGTNAMIGTEYVTWEAPDCYTLLPALTAKITIDRHLFPKSDPL